MKALSLQASDDNKINSASGSTQDGGAHGFGDNTGNVNGDRYFSGPPRWFQDFEARQEVRFDNIKEIFDGFKMEMDNMNDEIKFF